MLNKNDNGFISIGRLSKGDHIMVSVNENALEIVESMLDWEEELKIRSHKLANGATVIDCGVEVPGSLEAGIAFTEVCMGGLGSASLIVDYIEGIPFTFINVSTDQPAISCLGAQKAGWQIKVGKYFAMGSGPARALALKPKKTYEKIDYEDDFDTAIIALESNKLPDEEVIKFIAEECDVEEEDVYALVAPTASIVGSVQVSGRVVETAIYKLAELGYDVKKVVSGIGRAPVAPVVNDDLKSMGITNDSIIYYGSVVLTVEEYTEEIDQLPSNRSKDYGRPFYVIFKEANYDFYKIDPYMFAPAHVLVNDLKEGKTYELGTLNSKVILESYGVIKKG